MKRLVLLLFLFSSLSSAAQLHVTVTPAGTFTWCYKDSVGYIAKISGTDTSGVSYQWQKNGMDIFGADSSFLLFLHAKSSDTGEYRCIATGLGWCAHVHQHGRRHQPAIAVLPRRRQYALAVNGQSRTDWARGLRFGPRQIMNRGVVNIRVCIRGQTTLLHGTG